MNHPQISTLEDAGRHTAVWGDDAFVHQPRFGEVFAALVPASLILATATALLVALL
jgi:hypothetical protein